MKRYDISIVGLSSTGNTFRAVDLHNDDVIYNLPVAEAAVCRVINADGSVSTGLEVGGTYAIAGSLNANDLDDGGVVNILRPRQAKVMADLIDFEALEMGSAEANRRPAPPLQRASAAQQQAAAAEATSDAVGEEAPF